MFTDASVHAKRRHGGKPENSRRNSENWPGFPRAQRSRDDYNRREEKQPLPMTCKVLYSEGIGRGLDSGVGYAERGNRS
jgi:thioredoxin reductase